jgi:hypothetical protein
MSFGSVRPRSRGSVALEAAAKCSGVGTLLLVSFLGHRDNRNSIKRSIPYEYRSCIHMVFFFWDRPFYQSIHENIELHFTGVSRQLAVRRDHQVDDRSAPHWNVFATEGQKEGMAASSKSTRRISLAADAFLFTPRLAASAKVVEKFAFQRLRAEGQLFVEGTSSDRQIL